jgi:hypothetical protein
MAISKKVWRRGWRREAAETQAASAELASVIDWLQQRDFRDSAQIIREIALRYGACAARDNVEGAITLISAKRQAVL